MQTLGVIGFGNISIRHRQNLKILFPDSRVVGLSARDIKPTQTVKYADQVVSKLDELIELQPTLVIVASPASLHVNHAIKLIAAGIPTLIEKPVADSVAQSQPLLTAVNNNATAVAVGYCLRYMPSAKHIKALLEQKMLGSIYTVSVNVGQFLPDWRPDMDYRQSVSAQSSLGGGVLLELSHELDYLRWFLGDLQVGQAYLRNTCKLDLAVEEIADLVLINEQGTVCNLHMDFVQQQPQRTCSFIGEKGRLDWDLVTNTISYHHKNLSEILFSAPDWDRNTMYLDMLNDFIANIQGKGHSCVDVFDAHKTLALIDNIKLKAQWGPKQ